MTDAIWRNYTGRRRESKYTARGFAHAACRQNQKPRPARAKPQAELLVHPSQTRTFIPALAPKFFPRYPPAPLLEEKHMGRRFAMTIVALTLVVARAQAELRFPDPVAQLGEIR